MEILNILFLANAGAAASSNWMMIGLFIILIAFTYFGMTIVKEATTTKNANDGQIEEG